MKSMRFSMAAIVIVSFAAGCSFISFVAGIDPSCWFDLLVLLGCLTFLLLVFDGEIRSAIDRAIDLTYSTLMSGWKPPEKTDGH